MRTPTLAAALCGATVVALAAFAASALAGGNPPASRRRRRACWTRSRRELRSSGSSPSATRCRTAIGSSRSPTASRSDVDRRGRRLASPGQERRRGRAVSTSSSTTRPRPSRSRSAIPAERHARPRAQNDFDNAQVSRLTLNDETAGVLDGRVGDHERRGFQRFCSSFLATKWGVRSPDPVHERGSYRLCHRRPLVAWLRPTRATGARQVGCVAYDVQNDKRDAIWRHGPPESREQRRVPGLSDGIVLSRATTPSSAPCPRSTRNRPRPRRCLRTRASSGRSCPTPTGRLLTGRHRNPDPVRSRCRTTSPQIADGDDLAGTRAIRSPDPPTQRHRQRRHGVDGPQWVLDQWGMRQQLT